MVADILIACIDNLKGFAEAIATIYPATEVQTCEVHQIRNSIKYLASKDQKAFMADLKPVYQATHKDQGAFPSDMSLLKLIYLATQNIQKKWTQPCRIGFDGLPAIY